MRAVDVHKCWEVMSLLSELTDDSRRATAILPFYTTSEKSFTTETYSMVWRFGLTEHVSKTARIKFVKIWPGPYKCDKNSAKIDNRLNNEEQHQSRARHPLVCGKPNKCQHRHIAALMINEDTTKGSSMRIPRTPKQHRR